MGILLAHAGVLVILIDESPSGIAIIPGRAGAFLIVVTEVPPTSGAVVRVEAPPLGVPRVVLELPAPVVPAPPSQIHDWMADGQHAAGRIGAREESSVRSFGDPQREAAGPRKAKPFGWDKTHTQRVEVIPGIGTRVRLNDRCDLLVSLIPMVGCSLGRIPARGDLFDEMNGAVELGSPNDFAVLTK
jgi:hypothetical protein